MEDIILIGCGGHAKIVVDSIETEGKYKIVGFLDNHPFEYRGYQVIGTDDRLESLYEEGIRNAFISIGFMGENQNRSKLYQRMKRIGYQFITVIDTTAVVATDAELLDGIYIGKHSVVNAGAKIGAMSIVNTGVIVEHDCIVGNGTHLAVGCVLCGGVRIGEHTLIGANATILQGKVIGNHVCVGASSIIVDDIRDNVTVYCKKTYEIKSRGRIE